MLYQVMSQPPEKCGQIIFAGHDYHETSWPWLCLLSPRLGEGSISGHSLLTLSPWLAACTGWEFAGCKNHAINGQAKSWPLCYFTLHNSECLVECECSYLLMVPPGKNKHELSGPRHVWQWSCGVPRYWAGLGLQKSFCIPLISMGRVNVHVHVYMLWCMYVYHCIACGVHACTCVVV